ncbi:ribosomal protein S2, flavodoxin-like domain-containing protein [Aspergillus avenaceus]|uniref:Ribosomal protein S2, flavodoxin-like domain-containing protein n=1 Tax=Aspergillus avenaceus TaxID=36643 RepID=A0A5N6TUW2_ASPAV|nr:ribosomal protein S2, flavodoxin-like domain-containing protein [Aspergillus avenaceus]
MIARQLCMRQSRQLHAFSRQARALNSVNRLYSIQPPVDTAVKTIVEEQGAPKTERGLTKRASRTAFIEKEKQKTRFHKLGSVVKDAYRPEDIIRTPPTPSDVTLELLLASQTHLGHSTSRWNPQNSRYIFGIRDGIHVISLDVTAAHLRRAAKVVEGVAARGGLILFVGTRKGQKRYVVRAAELAGGYHIFERWIPGSLTNGEQILGHCDTKVVNGLDEELPIYKQAIADFPSLKPDLVVCLNPLENVVLLHECGLNNVPTIGVIDTDADPTRVTYPIPANDDSLRSIGVIAGVLGRAGEAGQAMRLEQAKKSILTYSQKKMSKFFTDAKLAEVGKLQAENALAEAEAVQAASEESVAKQAETETPESVKSEAEVETEVSKSEKSEPKPVAEAKETETQASQAEKPEPEAEKPQTEKLEAEPATKEPETKKVETEAPAAEKSEVAAEAKPEAKSEVEAKVESETKSEEPQTEKVEAQSEAEKPTEAEPASEPAQTKPQTQPPKTQTPGTPAKDE